MIASNVHRLTVEDKSVGTGDGFSGGIVDNQTVDIHNYFPGYTLEWPYISKNLDHQWEVKDTIEKSISPFVP